VNSVVKKFKFPVSKPMGAMQSVTCPKPNQWQVIDTGSSSSMTLACRTPTTITASAITPGTDRASSVFRVQGELDFKFSRWIVLTQSCRLSSTRLPLGKSCEFSVQCSGWVRFKFFKMKPKVVDSLASWQIVRVQCSGFRVGWVGFGCDHLAEELICERACCIGWVGV
jgi:hypothetical protein